METEYSQQDLSNLAIVLERLDELEKELGLSFTCTVWDDGEDIATITTGTSGHVVSFA